MSNPSWLKEKMMVRGIMCHELSQSGYGAAIASTSQAMLGGPGMLWHELFHQRALHTSPTGLWERLVQRRRKRRLSRNGRDTWARSASMLAVARSGIRHDDTEIYRAVRIHICSTQCHSIQILHCGKSSLLHQNFSPALQPPSLASRYLLTNVFTIWPQYYLYSSC